MAETNAQVKGGVGGSQHHGCDEEEENPCGVVKVVLYLIFGKCEKYNDAQGIVLTA
jgi:hypothetical protein